jgi:4'-phosphopantetheinyl transferase
VLGRYLDVPPEEVTFRYGRAGKPELSPLFHDTDLHFNVSHSHGHLLVAVARNCAVGIDIEMIRPEMNIEAIAERFFSSEETQQLRALTGLEKREGFFNCWTRKEAYLSQGRGHR